MTILRFVVFVPLFFIFGCSRQPAVLTFVSDLHTPTVCGVMPYAQDVSVDTFQFYVSAISVKIAGQWRSVPFIPSNQQTNDTALIDLLPNCDTPEQTQVNVPLAMSHHQFADVERIRFKLGVPFEHNHSSPITLPSPLNRPEMFWSWQRGHKFARFDTTNKETQAEWNFHLGSVGCDSASAMRRPEEVCSKPNLLDITLEMDSADGVIMVPTQAWLSDINISTDTGCMFDQPIEPSCTQLLSNLRDKGFRWVAR